MQRKFMDIGCHSGTYMSVSASLSAMLMDSDLESESAATAATLSNSSTATFTFFVLGPQGLLFGRLHFLRKYRSTDDASSLWNSLETRSDVAHFIRSKCSSDLAPSLFLQSVFTCSIALKQRSTIALEVGKVEGQKAHEWFEDRLIRNLNTKSRGAICSVLTCNQATVQLYSPTAARHADKYDASVPVYTAYNDSYRNARKYQIDSQSPYFRSRVVMA